MQDWGVRACVRACARVQVQGIDVNLSLPSVPCQNSRPGATQRCLRRRRRRRRHLHHHLNRKYFVPPVERISPRRPHAFLLLHLHGRRPPTRSTTYTTRYRRSPFHGFLLLGEQVGDHLLSHASPNTLSTSKNPRNATGTCEDYAGPQLTTSLQRRPPPIRLRRRGARPARPALTRTAAPPPPPPPFPVSSPARPARVSKPSPNPTLRGAGGKSYVQKRATTKERCCSSTRSAPSR